MRVFRIQKTKYGEDITGEGSNKVEGRWSIVGSLKILYTAENKSLALLEKIGSFTLSPGIKLPEFSLIEIEVPDHRIVRFEIDQLPIGWENGDRKSSQAFGVTWLSKNESLAISVPSVISGDRNILINPQHRYFNSVKVVSALHNFKIDPRLARH